MYVTRGLHVTIYNSSGEEALLEVKKCPAPPVQLARPGVGLKWCRARDDVCDLLFCGGNEKR